MVDINRHPLIRQAYELCHAIEACGASEAQTNAAIKASKLMSDIEADVAPGEAVGRETKYPRGSCDSFGHNLHPKHTSCVNWQPAPGEDLNVIAPRGQGMCNTKEYHAYAAARQRCINPNDKAYHLYGGRGIEFKFANFEEYIAALGSRPSDQHSADRINNNGSYEIGNMRWATKKEQMANRRNTPCQNCTHPRYKHQQEWPHKCLAVLGPGQICNCDKWIKP